MNLTGLLAAHPSQNCEGWGTWRIQKDIDFYAHQPKP
jgi:hypothetical protein